MAFTQTEVKKVCSNRITLKSGEHIKYEYGHVVVIFYEAGNARKLPATMHV